MHRVFLTLLILALLCFLPTTASADLGFDFSCTQVDAGNLFNDSTNVTDAYTTASSTIYYYPYHKTEITFNNNYSYYRDRIYLGYYSVGGGLTFIPTSEGSKFPLHFSTNFTGMLYRQGMASFDNNTFNASAFVGHAFNPSARARVGLSYKSTAYVRSESSDQESIELSVGANVRLFGSNVIDAEVGWSFANISYIDSTDEQFYLNGFPARIGPDRFYRIDERPLSSVYVSPRFSRPIGSKTGISATYAYRQFASGKQAILLGFVSGDINADNLSPWSTVWQGSSVVLMIKSYVIPKFILSGGVGYWDKHFLTTYYGEDGIDYFGQLTQRHDEKSKYYISIQDPILTGSGALIEATLSADYTNNTSSKPLYDYSGLSVSIGVRLHL